MQEAGGFALGGVGLALIFYALFMAFAVGPELGQRTIDAQGWPQTCQSTIASTVQRRNVPAASIPRLNVCRMVFGFYGQDGQRYCDFHGDRFNSGINSTVDALNGYADTINDWRTDQATIDAPDRCSCASSLVLENERVSFALYAGSARLITPPTIRNLRSELRAALASPHCALEG